MGKGKEIKFKATTPRGRSLEGRQDGVVYRIYENRERAESCAPAYTVTTHDTKELGRTISTAGHLYFHLDGAKEFCQKIAAGEIDLEDLRAKFDAEDAEREQAVIRRETERAKEFRTILEKKGISYMDLLELEALRTGLGNIAHNILMGWERGEGLPNG